MIEYDDGASDNRRWANFVPRPDDIIISTPPKAGTTLTQMLCALLIFDGPDFPGSLEEVSPWFDQITRTDDDSLAMLEAQQHRRIIKTHTPLDGLPSFDEVTYISVHRDPRDIFVSWIHHAANIHRGRFFAAVKAAGYTDRLMAHRQDQPESWDDRFTLWLGLRWEHSVFALARIARHAVVADQHRRAHGNVLMLHYADLCADPVGALEQIGAAIGVATTLDQRVGLAQHAGMDAMRANAQRRAPTTKGQLADPQKFFRSGTGGEWRSLVSADAQGTYDARADQLLTPELRTWLERS